MSANEAKELIAEIQRQHAESEEELRGVQDGIEALRMLAEEIFPETTALRFKGCIVHFDAGKSANAERQWRLVWAVGMVRKGLRGGEVERQWRRSPTEKPVWNPSTPKEA